jgi:hypothetical protein
VSSFTLKNIKANTEEEKKSLQFLDHIPEFLRFEYLQARLKIIFEKEQLIKQLEQ